MTLAVDQLDDENKQLSNYLMETAEVKKKPTESKKGKKKK